MNVLNVVRNKKMLKKIHEMNECSTKEINAGRNKLMHEINEVGYEIKCAV